MVKTNCNYVCKGLPVGSALILTVVLTSMLAIVGILFVMMARVDKVATSAISENRELDLAVETVVDKISQQLVLDVPGILVQEYYDYPDANNAWLASLEPYQFAASDYRWRHISDVNNQLGPGAWDLPADIKPDYQLPVEIRDSNVVNGVFRADADGDGISDSVWIKIPDITSSKGEPIYAAVRVVDNEAMLNANAHFKFDPNAVDANQIDGSSQLQVNFIDLSWRQGFSVYDPCDEIDLLEARASPAFGLNPLDLRQYERDVIWRYGRPNGPYTPFDISDELEMRYRYLLNHTGIDTRLEELGVAQLRSWEFRRGAFRTPAQAGDLDEWFISAYDAGLLDPNYAYRHITTTYNMDRIIDPNGDKMINVNEETSAFKIYDRLWRSMYPFVPDPNTDARFAQLAVNMVDFADDDPHTVDSNVLDPCCVTTLIDASGIIHYGFEAQPFINEIAWWIGLTPAVTANFFALELCNPFDKDIDLGNFVLEFVSRDLTKQYFITFPVGLVIEANGYFVIVNQAGVFPIFTDPNTPTTVWVDPALRFFEDWMTLDKSKPPIDLKPNPDKSKPPIPEGWGTIYDVSLLRGVSVPAPGTMLYVDNQIIEPNIMNLALPNTALAFGRDDRDWRVIYQTLAIDGAYAGSLGIANYRHIPFNNPKYPYPYPGRPLYSFFLPNPWDPHARLITVGDIPRILTLGHGTTPNSTIGRQLMTYELLEVGTLIDQEHNVRLDLQNPLYRNVFQYFTVFDPNSDNIDNDADGLTDEDDGSEWKVPGRININTAPWYVLAQLPWVTHPFTADPSIAKAIVAYRDKVPLLDGLGNLIADYGNRTAATGSPLPLREESGFASIGELATVVNTFDAPTSVPNYRNFSMRYHIDGFDLPYFPDLTTADDDPPYTIPDPCDEVKDDFEERDVIFSRISNLVSVRSDVFTAYILVRIGADGPQKRVVAILDRSGVNKMNIGLPAGRVRIVSLHDVPDPR